MGHGVKSNKFVISYIYVFRRGKNAIQAQNPICLDDGENTIKVFTVLKIVCEVSDWLLLVDIVDNQTRY